ncbi:hypothetical protein [Domibacillus robiginosus]|uniref:hypothetical protein n=1 Tax=Domibacillus robiginosus TaxID=1071054 RepID=UPI00067BFB18|nr:hypothetical protein [Domibacillus robiginosus]
MVNVLSYYEEVEGKFPVAAYLVDFSQGLDPAEREIDWLYNKGYSTIPHAIRRCKRVSPTEKLVLEEIYMSMGFKSESTITRKALSSLLDIGVDTVRANIEKLQEKNFLEVYEYNERYYYYVRPLPLNPYLIMSELTHSAQKEYQSNMPKSICDRGVQHRIGEIVKSKDYTAYIQRLKSDISYSNVLAVQNDYFRYIEEVIKDKNNIHISIPDN